MRNVSGAPDRPREEFPRRRRAGQFALHAKEDGLHPFPNKPVRYPDATYESPDAIIISPRALAEATRDGFITATSPARSRNQNPLLRSRASGVVNNEPFITYGAT